MLLMLMLMLMRGGLQLVLYQADANSLPVPFQTLCILAAMRKAAPLVNQLQLPTCPVGWRDDL
jgi:hypothetical protein